MSSSHIRLRSSGRYLADACKWCQGNSTCVVRDVCLCDACSEIVTVVERAPRLCDLCDSLFTDEAILKSLMSNGFDHATELYIKRSAEQGCPLCLMFRLHDPNPAMDARGPHSLSLYVNITGSHHGQNDLDQSSIGADICLLRFSSLEDFYQLKMSVSASRDDPASRNISQRPLHGNLGSEEHFKQIQEWLDKSNATDDDFLQCNRKIPRLPTRVIDVGGDSTATPVLFEPSSTMYAGYVALSYCWGRQSFVTTTLSSIAAHKCGLDLSSLPQVFIDAIFSTRMLGFRYIWIDALCMIQDSMSDKLQEIGQMCNIFNNAVFCIAAMTGESAAVGFLEPKWNPPTVELPYKCKDGAIGTVLVSPQLTIDMWEEPLFTRAWTLQETMLCPCILYFTRHDILWQTQNNLYKYSSDEHFTYVNANPDFLSSPFHKIPVSIFNGASDQSATEDMTMIAYERYRIWTMLVGNYTRRKLTLPEDKLPAIGGIAQKLRDSWKDKYYAGIFEASFIDMLAWQRERSIPGEFLTLKTYRAPSWSWASLEGPVEFPYAWHVPLGNDRNLKAEFLTCQIIPTTENGSDFGQIRMAEVTLCASIIKARDPRVSQFSGDRQFDLQFDDISDGPDSNSTFDADSFIQEVLFMLLGSGRDGTGGRLVRTVALMLIPTADSKLKRVGILSSVSRKALRLWASPKDRQIIVIV